MRVIPHTPHYGCFAIHSRAMRWALAIWAGVMSEETDCLLTGQTSSIHQFGCALALYGSF